MLRVTILVLVIFFVFCESKKFRAPIVCVGGGGGCKIRQLTDYYIIIIIRYLSLDNVNVTF